LSEFSIVFPIRSDIFNNNKNEGTPITDQGLGKISNSLQNLQSLRTVTLEFPG